MFLTKENLNNNPDHPSSAPTRLTFKKAERLKSKKIIQALFEKGHVIKQYPLQLLWLPLPGSPEFPVQALFTVSSRRFPRAVIRNRIKRQLKEAYRHNKMDLYSYAHKHQKCFALAWIYIGREMPEYNTLDNKIKLILDRFMEDNETNAESI